MRFNNHVLLLKLPGLEKTNTLASAGNTPGSVSFSHFSWTGIGADKFWGVNEVNQGVRQIRSQNMVDGDIGTWKMVGPGIWQSETFSISLWL